MFNYVKYNPNKTYDIGDICIIDNNIYVYMDYGFEIIGNYNFINNKNNYNPHIYKNNYKPYICTQCGAPLTNNICEYCGTKYQ